MNALVDTPEKVALLREIAKSWEGTSWIPDGAVKGTGASCTMLPYAIMAELGHAAPLPPPRYTIKKNEIFSVITDWMRDHPDFYAEILISEIIPGDVLLFDCGIGHAGICTGATEMLHTWQTTGAHFTQFTEKNLFTRLRKAWRPITHGPEQSIRGGEPDGCAELG